MESTAVQKIDTMHDGTFSVQGFAHAEKVAKMMADSSLVPDHYKGKVANCLIALEMANRIGASPMMVMQNLHVIQGRPSWSSTFIIGSLNSCGRFEPLQFKQVGGPDTNADNYGYLAFTKDKRGAVLEGPAVTWNMIKAEGWLAKNGSKWKTMPELMFRYRAAAFFGRLYAPDVLMGMQTAEEIIDVHAVEEFDVEANRKDKEAERITTLIKEATTLSELNPLKQYVSTAEQLNLFETKHRALS